MSAEVCISAVGLRCEFANGSAFWQRPPTVAVKDISFDVQVGETFAIVGESGSGKTTTARMIMGTQKPTAGSLELFGNPLDRYGRLERAAMIQMVFQDPYSSLNPRRSVRSILTSPLKLHGETNRAARDQRAAEVLDSVALARRHMDSYPDDLSGGQRQRVAIARALILRPRIVVYDEPTSALDVSVQAQILNLLADLKKQFGLTYIFISHNLSVVDHVADRIAVMKDGAIVEQAARAEVFQNPRHEYTRMLIEASPDMGAVYR